MLVRRVDTYVPTFAYDRLRCVLCCALFVQLWLALFYQYTVFLHYGQESKYYTKYSLSIRILRAEYLNDTQWVNINKNQISRILNKWILLEFFYSEYFANEYLILTIFSANNQFFE